MNATQKSRFLKGLVGVFVLATAAGVRANVRGVITTTQGRELPGVIRWQPASRIYTVEANNVVLRIPVNEVASVRVQDRPQRLEPAIAAVRRGQYQAAIPVLEQIMQEYTRLQWDIPAARWLAESHLKLNDPARAVRICEGIIEEHPEMAWTGDFPTVYWEALLQTEQFVKLRRVLGQAAERGDRRLAAVAQIKRGDIDRRNNDLESALVDGYLRTIVFFAQERSVLPEALYKATKCFEALGQHSHAENMRKRLLAEFPGDPYTERLKSES